MSCLYLIRHAETALNASRTVQWPDTPLNRRGEWQAGRLAARLRDAGLTRIVTSDYARARSTAESVRDTTSATLTFDARLRERHMGELRGQPYSKVRDQVFADDFEPAYGESWPSFHARVANLWRALRLLINATHGALAVVTHGFVCGALVERHLRLDQPSDGGIYFANASVTVVDATPPWHVRALANAEHLG